MNGVYVLVSIRIFMRAPSLQEYSTDATPGPGKHGAHPGSRTSRGGADSLPFAAPGYGDLRPVRSDGQGDRAVRGGSRVRRKVLAPGAAIRGGIPEQSISRRSSLLPGRSSSASSSSIRPPPRHAGRRPCSRPGCGDGSLRATARWARPGPPSAA